jgi:hypothetical protein
MSRDQKPGKSKIVVNATPAAANAIAAVDPKAAQTVPAAPAKPPIVLMAALFLAICAAAGAGVALLGISP